MEYQYNNTIIRRQFRSYDGDADDDDDDGDDDDDDDDEYDDDDGDDDDDRNGVTRGDVKNTGGTYA